MLYPILSSFGNTHTNSSESVLPTALGGAGLFALAPAVTAQPLQHYGRGTTMRDFNAFQKKLRPGDILISGSKDILPIPTGVNLVTGNPYGQHVSVVDAPTKRWDIDSHPAYGFNIAEGNIDKKNNLQVLRFKDKQIRDRVLRGMRGMAKSTNVFEAEIARQLVRKGWERGSAVSYAQLAASSLYDTPTGVKAGLKELFVPNINSAEKIKMRNQENYLANKTFMRNAKSYGRTIADMLHAHPNPERVNASEIRKALPRCTGGVCSSMPAILGRFDVANNRAARDVLTSDYLKSEHLKPVMRYYGGKPEKFMEKAYFSAMSKAPRLLRSIPGLGLLGAGIGLAMNNKRDQTARLRTASSAMRQAQPLSYLLNKNNINLA